MLSTWGVSGVDRNDRRERGLRSEGGDRSTVAPRPSYAQLFRGSSPPLRHLVRNLPLAVPRDTSLGVGHATFSPGRAHRIARIFLSPLLHFFHYSLLTTPYFPNFPIASRHKNRVREIEHVTAFYMQWTKPDKSAGLRTTLTGWP
jgi:hypothetical protein